LKKFPEYELKTIAKLECNTEWAKKE